MGFPRHLSQHVGGFVIARGLLERMVPVENAAMPERTVIQWDKDDLDALGLLKVDCLALGMLTAIRRTLCAGRRLQRTRADDAGDTRRRPCGLRDVPARRHGRRVPDRVARADGDAAAVEAGLFLRSRHRGRDRAAGADPGRHGASVPAPAAGGGARHLSERRGEKRARAHARRADLPGAGDAARDRRRRLFARRGRSPAARDGRVAAPWRARDIRAAADRRHGGARLERGVRAPDLPADPGLRRIRFPGIALGLLRAARVRVGVAQMLRAGGFLRGAAQFAADGLLRAGAAGAGCPPARCRRAAGGRDGERVGLHAGENGVRHDFSCCASHLLTDAENRI